VNDFENIADLINSNSNFLIASHENPDEDAIGSTLSLGLALELLNKNVFLYNETGVPAALKFLPKSKKIHKNLKNIPFEIDAVVILDCTDFARVGKGFDKYIQNLSAINITIDHHFTKKTKSEYCILDRKAPSTGFLIYRLLKQLEIDISKDIAVNIYATIVGDTGSFAYSNTTSETFIAASELLNFGVNPYEISKNIYENEPLNKIKLLGRVLNTLELSHEGRVATVFVSREMFKVTDTTKQHTEGLVNYPRSIKGVDLAVLLRQEEDDRKDENWKISLRAKNGINVALIAQSFGGGGHKSAAGCSIKGDLNKVREKLVSEINKAIK
jgi:phosphoesterase RecJ-like protein